MCIHVLLEGRAFKISCRQRPLFLVTKEIKQSYVEKLFLTFVSIHSVKIQLYDKIKKEKNITIVRNNGRI